LSTVVRGSKCDRGSIDAISGVWRNQNAVESRRTVDGGKI